MGIEVSHEDKTYRLNKWIKINQSRYNNMYFRILG